VLSKSGHLDLRAVYQLTALASAVDLRRLGGPGRRADFIDVLDLFNRDPDTPASS